MFRMIIKIVLFLLDHFRRRPRLRLRQRHLSPNTGSEPRRRTGIVFIHSRATINNSS